MEKERRFPLQYRADDVLEHPQLAFKIRVGPDLPQGARLLGRRFAVNALRVLEMDPYATGRAWSVLLCQLERLAVPDRAVGGVWILAQLELGIQRRVVQLL